MPFYGTVFHVQGSGYFPDGETFKIIQGTDGTGGTGQAAQHFIQALFIRVTKWIVLRGFRKKIAAGMQGPGFKVAQPGKRTVSHYGINPVKETALLRIVLVNMIEYAQHAIVQCSQGLVFVVEKTFAQGIKGRVKLVIQFFLAMQFLSFAALNNMDQVIQIRYRFIALVEMNSWLSVNQSFFIS